ncbi:endonuclease/exonuclease/phosphatase family protein [Nonomuraea sp. MCN248]|uniref:Endonuclease/exonuclease/phosphatase family protein n=1 Tax=Nonomuraea corallina TaxID=2989783 RepID=A0ABT4SCR1_9ACTN|nr:endonuclease/exonuclease/phosphatase family protein [Nonomuraea corallina]MDA0635002.1 endonuclease/exonuclease/phosphatase family protein [Nonomuraea corallina]
MNTQDRTTLSWTRERVLAAVAVLVAVLMAFPGVLPNAVGRLGSLLETFRPWAGLAVPVLLVPALLRRSALALVSVMLPSAVWAGLFGARLLPAGQEAAHDLTVLQHNVNDENPDPRGTARALAAAGADLIALEELTPATRPVYEAVLAPGHPYHAVVGSVGLWSRHPLTDSRPVDIRPAEVGGDWNRGLRATVRTPHGDLAAYVAHLPSIRIGPSGFGSAWRDESAVKLGAALAAEPLDRIVLMGDLNSTLDDRGLAPVTSLLTPADEGFGFTWPAAFPLARIDHVMTRAATPVATWTLPATASDHLPVAARVKL